MSRSFRTKFPATHTQTTQYRIDYGLGDLGSDAKRRVPCQGGCGRRFLKLKSARWHYCDQCEQVAVLISEALEESIDQAVGQARIQGWWMKLIKSEATSVYGRKSVADEFVRTILELEKEDGLYLYLHNDRLYKLCQQQKVTVEQLCHEADVHPMVVDRAQWAGPIAREDVTKLATVLAVEPESLIVYSVEEIEKRQKELSEHV